MNGYDVFRVYQAVRLHFSNEKYDYFKYNGKTKTNEFSFNSRKDKYLFHKLAKMYDEDDVMYFIAVNFMVSGNVWIRDLLTEQAKENYTNWLKAQQSLYYSYKEDLEKLTEHNFAEIIKCNGGQNPELLNLLYQTQISTETFLIIDEFLNLIESWNKKIEDDFIWTDYRKRLLKYKPFFFKYSKIDLANYKIELKKLLQLQQNNI
jgi:hypothetical protein